MTPNISTLDFVAFDTETTGLYPASEDLLEIGAVRFDLVNGPREYFQTLIDPRRPIPPGATAIHGITDKMVAGAPAVEKALPSFFHFIRGAVPVAHNAPFDIGFIALHGLRIGLELPDIAVLDSCMFSRRVLTELRSHKLEFLTKEVLISPETTFHRALADAKNCMELFRHLIEKSCGIEASWDALVDRHGKVQKFINGSRSLDETELDDCTGALYEALRGKRSVWIHYEGGYGAREITPLLMYARGGNKYLEAKCHFDGLRKSYRIDRIKKVLTP